ALIPVCCLTGAVRAQRSAPVPFDVEIKAPPKVRLSISPNAISFPDADPDTVPAIAAQGNPVRVEIIARSAGQLTLTARATTHLVSGSETIACNHVTWQATGAGFQDGCLLLQTEVPVGKWLPLGVARIQGSLSFWLANSWHYAVGTYKATVVFTATAL
ncbi:MAG: hypothetical protein ACUVRZ_12625, partial [Desulfobacca sp.]|uniref:hypothetical protein n=1 Tax=Desulfobacca sp. TaxID=2067990 RepID=UPI00404A17BD